MIIETDYELNMLKKLITRNDLNTQQLSVMTRAVRNYEPKKQIVKNQTLSIIQNIVAAYYAVDPNFYDQDNRQGPVVNGRQIVWYFAEIYFKKIPLRVRGLHFGLDHATALHGYRTIKDEMEVNFQLKAEINAIDKLICQSLGLFYKI